MFLYFSFIIFLTSFILLNFFLISKNKISCPRLSSIQATFVKSFHLFAGAICTVVCFTISEKLGTTPLTIASIVDSSIQPKPSVVSKEIQTNVEVDIWRKNRTNGLSKWWCIKYSQTSISISTELISFAVRERSIVEKAKLTCGILTCNCS